LFEGRTHEPEPRSRADAVITLTFALIVVAVALTALGWWLVRPAEKTMRDDLKAPA